MLQKDDCQPFSLHKRVSACVEDFAPLPAVAMRVMDMVADPDTMAADLESVLQGDVSLVTAVLKLANSAFYGLRRQVISLRHALVLLGKNEVRGLVISRVMFQAFKVPAGRQKILMLGVWKHSLECALAAECIAEQCGAENSVYFLGGMLHDIGRLVIVQKFLKEIEDLDHYGQLVEKSGLEVELKLLGCGHNELGSQLLHRWMFPPQLVEMVQNHHNYDGIAACGRSSQILILANLLSRWAVLKDLEGKDEAQEAGLFALLLRCGADSKIIPDEKALVEMESAFRLRLEERADLLEMLKM
jgi:putative nucleotidyltransferase with HDIG domain